MTFTEMSPQTLATGLVLSTHTVPVVSNGLMSGNSLLIIWTVFSMVIQKIIERVAMFLVLKCHGSG